MTWHTRKDMEDALRETDKKAREKPGGGEKTQRKEKQRMRKPQQST